MKVVIIGGGIAGIAMGIFLHKKNIEVVVNERLADTPTRGHAFLMHNEGLLKLKELNPEHVAPLPGQMLNTFILKRPSGEEIKHVKLDSWKCVKRCNLIHFLQDLLPNENLKEGRCFSHFIYQDNKIIAAAFTNGEVEYGDIFVGADGGNSNVRAQIFGSVNFTPVAVKEIVGVAHHPKLSEKNISTFTKFQDNTQGLAFGMIPTQENEFVWFMQYDPAKNDLTNNTPEELSDFCNNLLKDFPPEVTELLRANDFSTSYLWNTRDFDLLPSFHHENVVLIGDAAHLSLPFTSAGTTNAIADAKTLADELAKPQNYQTAFEHFYNLRAKEIAGHIELGRSLKNLFLNPQNKHDDDIPVPLIIQQSRKDLMTSHKKIEVLYYTDPICSTCWILEPLLHRLKLEYANHLNITYCMGGMLPSWEEYPKGNKIQNPDDAAQHWEEVCSIYEIPLDGDIWIEDPLHSSYPPSIAFKAAQMQDHNLALLFLRRIKEMVFVEKKNIIKWEYLEQAAFETGLDCARLLRDFNGQAKELFKEDLAKGRELGITSFPTLIFSHRDEQHITIKGYKSYEHYENVILSMEPAAKKESINTEPRNLFSHFPTMADKEFAMLSNISKEEAGDILEDLYNQGHLVKFESKNGILWKNNYA